MAYIDVITLPDAKVYLRVDDDLTEDDTQIIRMINGALSYIEQYTNIYFYARDKSYNVIDSCVKVYDYPINSEVSTYTKKETLTLHTNYTTDETPLFTLNIGYVDVDDIPQELLEVAYTMIKSMYYEKESNKGILESLDTLSMLTLNQYKRFII